MDADGVCESPEIQRPEGVPERYNDCELLEACVSRTCAWVDCIDDCAIEVFGDEACGCCGEECDEGVEAHPFQMLR